MTPIEQTGFTLVCMLIAFFIGKKSGIKSGIGYIFNFMTDKEIQKVVKKIDKHEGRLS
jgi:hypothetical protein